MPTPNKFTEAVMEFEARWQVQQNELVRQHVDKHGTREICRQSMLPRAYCGGCFRKQH